MRTIFESLIKRGVLYNELIKANAPTIILRTEEAFFGEKINSLFSEMLEIAEELKTMELDNLIESSSPCFICNNAIKNQEDEITDCSKKHLIDKSNVQNRTITGCDDLNKNDNCYPNFIEKQDKLIEEKYSKENIKLVLKLICDKLLSL